MKTNEQKTFIKEKSPPVKENFEETAFRVSAVSIIGNTVLSVFKLLAGIFAHSGAMVSDAVHSASDIISSIIVIIGVKMSSKTADRDHPYGHERFECVAAIVLAVILLVTGLFIGHAGIEKIIGNSSSTIGTPGILALVAAIVSIVCKEAMYWYTIFWAKRFDSGALRADAWHHRSDALSSVGALIGIVGARVGYPLLDTAASLVICLFIIKAAYDIFRDAIEKMVDRSCDAETERQMSELIEAQDGVLGIELLKTRVFGSKIYVDAEILADARCTLDEAHEIAHKVHAAIEERFTNVKHIMVHVDPLTDRDADVPRE